MQASTLFAIETEVNRIANMYNVSRSWVIATVLADAFHIKGHVPYQSVSKIRRVK